MEQSTINGSAVSPTRSHEAIVSRRSRNASGVSLVVAALSVAAVTLSIASSHVSARTRREPALSTAKLTLEHIGSDSTAFDVLATLVIGPKEVLLWDTQYHLNDARRVADRIAASGRTLKAIVLSHPDHDHYMGAAAIVERFPGTPVYMTAKALAEYQRTASQSFRAEKSRTPQLLPDSLVTPRPLPSTRLTLDGESLEVIADVTGDVGTGTNSMLWIPSLETVLASDVVFNDVHPWLGASDSTTRVAWRAALKRIKSLEPRFVVAGHKKDVNAPDSPAVVDVMDRYLVDFDALRATSTNASALYDAMIQKYPDHAVRGLLRYATQMAFRRNPGHE